MLHSADCSANTDNSIGMVTIITIVWPFPTSKAAEPDQQTASLSAQRTQNCVDIVVPARYATPDNGLGTANSDLESQHLD